MKNSIALGLILLLTNMTLAEGTADWSNEVISARGMCAIKSAKPYHRIVAREKARIRAERDLLGTMKSLKIDANTTMIETMKSSDYKETIIRQIRGVLKGAKITKEEVKGDVSYVTLTITMADVRKALLLSPFPEQPISIRNPYVIPGKNFQEETKKIMEKCHAPLLRK